MQSTGHSSMQDLSLTSMHGSLMVYVIFGSTPLWAHSSHWLIPPRFPRRQTLAIGVDRGPGVTPPWATRLIVPSRPPGSPLVRGGGLPEAADGEILAACSRSPTR